MNNKYLTHRFEWIREIAKSIDHSRYKIEQDEVSSFLHIFPKGEERTLRNQILVVWQDQINRWKVMGLIPNNMEAKEVLARCLLEGVEQVKELITLLGQIIELKYGNP